MSTARRKAIKSLCDHCGSATGLAGSSAPIALAAIESKVPVIVIGDSLDDAGYLYFDLCRILGEENVAILPSGFKRDIKYGQVDPPNQILRTETLTRISTGNVRFVVTYPDAIAECVASREDIKEHTITLRKDSRASMHQTEQWLKENGFKETDYVYEPGQYAIRGSIFDIYGYSDELPYRLDFFGDEIDSIRTFNVETQLSESRLDSVDITANVSHRGQLQSILDFIDPSSIIAFRNMDLTLERLRAIKDTNVSAFTLLTDEGDPAALELVIDPYDFENHLAEFKRLSFTAAKPGEDHTPARSRATTTLAFDCTPQGVYHKKLRYHSRIVQPFHKRRLQAIHSLRQRKAIRPSARNFRRPRRQNRI